MPVLQGLSHVENVAVKWIENSEILFLHKVRLCLGWHHYEE